MDLTTSPALVTGANRGLGAALVAELLRRGVPRVYAAARQPEPNDDSRVVPLRLDITDNAQIGAAASVATDVRLLVNNAGTAEFADPFAAERAAVAREMSVNHTGTFDVIRGFAPVIEAAGGGAVVNVLTLLSFTSMPAMAGYSASKAAAHSMTQAIRPGLAVRGITVHGVYPGAIDTDMLAGIDMPKTPPHEVAAAIVDGVLAGDAEIYPDPMSRRMGELRDQDRQAFEQAFRDLAAG